MSEDRISVVLWQPQQAYAVVQQAWQFAKAMLIAGHRLVLEIRPENRSDAQNRRMWAMLADVASQVDWYGRKLSPEDWKHVFTAGLRKMDVVPNLDGTGFVALGLSTRRMTRRELSDLMELMSAFGAERGVVWSEQEDIAA